MRKTITIPENLSEITLAKYLKFSKMQKGKEVDTEFLNRKALEIFYDIDPQYYEKIKAKDVLHLVSELTKVLKMKPQLIDRFELDAIQYGMIPNFDDITLGELIDLDELQGHDNMVRMMSILYRPIVKEQGRNYSIEPYRGTHYKLKNMPLEVALSAVNFFETLGIILMTCTLKSFSPTEIKQASKKISERNGDGMEQYTNFQMATP